MKELNTTDDQAVKVAKRQLSPAATSCSSVGSTSTTARNVVEDIPINSSGIGFPASTASTALLLKENVKHRFKGDFIFMDSDFNSSPGAEAAY